MAAIRFGYELTDDEIARLAAAAPPSRFQMNTAATAELTWAQRRPGVDAARFEADDRGDNPNDR